ncbi:HNH endonuclease [Novipirellula sp.]|uniref:HNH endonuclease n=1 Tax=Novipirellula sp. TaxID=2795430 RepID=UPI00356B4E06
MTLEAQFDDAMLGIHRAAGELTPPYRAHGFLSMVRQHGGKETADRLLAKTEPSEGFTELFLRGPENLTISVEYLVLCNPWRQLFTDDQLAIACQRLRDVQCPLPPDDSEASMPPLPEELDSDTQYTEGATKSVVINAYERNAHARSACIAHYGSTCHICGFDFGATYGDIADGYIHVHHLRPLSECGGEYDVDPIDDLRPVCPNCHAVIHLGGACRSIAEIKALLDAQ